MRDIFCSLFITRNSLSYSFSLLWSHNVVIIELFLNNNLTLSVISWSCKWTKYFYPFKHAAKLSFYNISIIGNKIIVTDNKLTDHWKSTVLSSPKFGIISTVLQKLNVHSNKFDPQERIVPCIPDPMLSNVLLLEFSDLIMLLSVIWSWT